ncbi:MAG: quinol:cytochrome C oxidoreductase, partial [Candidatus Hydrogenedens sp.]|nr:quinol:cytochrome C oxidoreductase [Candidatus Hydrogenedens sp.]
MTSAADTKTTELAGAPRPSAPLRLLSLGLVAAGVLLSLPALFSDGGRAQFAHGYLMGFTFVWGIALGSLFWVVLHHLTHARWSVVVRRVMEMLAEPVWLAGLFFIPLALMVVLNARFHLYEWADPGIVAGDALLQGKRPYLNTPFFILRGLVFFGLWIGFARFFVRGSLSQDNGGAGAGATLRMRSLSPAFMLVFAVTVTFAGIDWLMSLSPRWFSTIFGVYVFGGIILTSLAAVTVATVGLLRTGRISARAVTPDHLYNLGAFLFAFTIFWAYIAFSQYMLIWYGNMPEESFYMVRRLEDGWLKISLALAAMRLFIPFFVLLSRRAKRNATVLFWVSLLILAGQLLDLYWLIMPEALPGGPTFGWRGV